MKATLRWLMSALLMLALCLPTAPARAEQAHFEFDPLTGTITGYLGPGGDVVVPEAIAGVPVTRIGQNAFAGNKELTSIALPAGLRRLEHSAFYFCENLRAIELPAGLEVIAPYALFACYALESLEVPAAISYIGDQALASCYNLRAITFTGAPPLLGEGAFDHGAEGRQITVPAEDQAAYEALLFEPCQPGGARVAVDQVIPAADFRFDAASGTLTGYAGEAAHVIVPAQIDGVPVRAVGAQAFFGDKNIIRLELPEGLEAIGDRAFYAAALVGVRLPQSLRSIGEEAFRAARLSELELPQGVGQIGAFAFAANTLRTLALPEGLSELPEGAFQGNRALGEAYLPASLARLGAQAFAGCDQLDYLVFAGRTLPALGEGAFADCPIADVDIGWDADKAQVAAARDALAQAGLAMEQTYVWRANRADEPPYPSAAEASFVFDEATGAITSYEGDLHEMTMYWNFYAQDGSLMAIRALGEGLFEGSALRRFFVPHSDQLQIIGERAFAHSQLEEIYLFDSVTEIGAGAFRGCQGLARIEVPASVERIGAGAFEDCAALAEVIFAGGMPVIEADAFKGCAALEALTLPAQAQVAGDLGVAPQIVRIADEASDEQVQAMAQALALPWFLDLRRAGEDEAFARMPDVANAEADFEFEAATGTVTKYIGQSAEVVVPREIGGVAVQRIGTLAFSDASVMGYLTDTAKETGLTQVILPETLRFIDDSAFVGSRSLERVICYGPIDRLGIRAFEQCTALEGIAFVNGIREIDLYAFYLSEALHDVSLGDRLASIGEGAFSGTGLRDTLTLTAPEIGPSAFRACEQIRTIRVTAAVEQIGMGAFLELAGLERIYFDRPDVDILGYGKFQFSEDMGAFELCLPTDATDDQVAAFVSALDQNLLPGAEMVVRADFG